MPYQYTYYRRVIFLWIQGSKWSERLPCLQTGRLTYRTPWTVSPGTHTRNPTPRRSSRFPSPDTAVIGKSQSPQQEPVSLHLSKFLVYKVCIDIESSANKIIIKSKRLHYTPSSSKTEKKLPKKKTKKKNKEDAIKWNNEFVWYR